MKPEYAKKSIHLPLISHKVLSSTRYDCLCLKNQSQNNFKWINYVESIFNRAGLGYIFINQVGYCDKTYLNRILSDQFVSSWYNDIDNSSRGQLYGSFKKKFGLENYLVKLNEKTRIWMTKLRASNLCIPIETGRWFNIPKDERVCTLCGQSIGDEFHLLFVCCNEYLVNMRRIYLPRYYVTYPSIVKMYGLLSFCNVEVYKRLSLFIKKIAGMF
jgi:hypothetical protein